MADDVDFKQHFEDFINHTQEERTRAESRRDYRDLKQWTAQQAASLQERGQAAIVFDQFGKKVDAICGLVVERRSDPRAYPVTPKHEKAADAITDALRYVEKHTHFDELASEVFEDKIVEGYGGCIIEVNAKTKDIEINQLYWDRIYFDPYSRRKDYKDSKYFGITLWMDIEDAKEINPKKSKELDQLLQNTDSADGETFDDRPNQWIDAGRKRIRVNQEYYLSGGVWTEVFYSGSTVINEPKPSPYKDSDGEPMNPIELQSDYVDRDNNRYGWSERIKDPQDEINHRRSKALFMLSSKSLIADKGAFGDQDRHTVLEELRKGMSYLEPIQGARVEIDSQQDLGQSQLAFYQDAQNAMDSVGINPELTGGTENAISGRAFIARQQGGMVELARIMARHSEWKQRVYAQIWARVKQFWKKEKWVRVTDDSESMKFVGLNIPITAAEKLLEEKTGMDIQELMDEHPEVEQLIEQMTAQDARLSKVVETRNNVPEMDMDIVLEEAPDTIAIQQEQFETLAQLASSRVDPQMFEALVKLSNMRNKDEVLESFTGNEQAQEQAQQQRAQESKLQQAAAGAEVENKQADTQLKMSAAQKNEADTKKSLSEIMLNQAKAKDEIASSIQRISSASALPN